MTDLKNLPRILIIDDLFGRTHFSGHNVERANLCGQFLIEDITGDENDADKPTSRIKQPIAQAVFWRGQKPSRSRIGDLIENDLEGTLQFIQTGWDEAVERGELRWSLVLLDLCFYTGTVTAESDRKAAGMPDGREGDDNPNSYFGLQILKAIKERFPDLPVLILSSKPRGEVSREFTQFGALGFLPRNEENSSEVLRDYIWRHGLIPDETGGIIGHSKSLLLTLRAARRAASGRQNILIRGERGTGKELLASYINRHSARDINKKRPLITVDSGTLNPHLYASELFGHRRGAFTGADQDRAGKIQQADGGDLFLDEIGNLSLDVQMALLRVLEYRQVTPLGASRGQTVDVRFLTATNEDLTAKANTGGFRQDLLDRLREGGTLYLSPLRERPEDLDLLVEYLVRQAETSKLGVLKRDIEPSAFELIRTISWEGNIRELRNVIFGAVLNYPDVEHLQPFHLNIKQTNDSALWNGSQTKRKVSLKTEHQIEKLTLDDLIELLAGFELSEIKPSEISGRLPVLQEAYARFLSRLIRAALEITSKPTLEHLEGKILIHPAVKLLTGDGKITASKAADTIKRLLSLLPDESEILETDPVLREAYETALRLRPRQPSRKT